MRRRNFLNFIKEQLGNTLNCFFMTWRRRAGWVGLGIVKQTTKKDSFFKNVTKYKVKCLPNIWAYATIKKIYVFLQNTAQEKAKRGMPLCWLIHNQQKNFIRRQANEKKKRHGRRFFNDTKAGIRAVAASSSFYSGRRRRKNVELHGRRRRRRW